MIDLPNAVGKIKLLLMDCDGVLTDGRLYFTASGEALKVFHVRDGQGLVMWHAAGGLSGIISGRGAEEIINRRADELGISFLRVNSKDKREDFLAILEEADVKSDEVAFIGDDVGDIELMKLVGLPVAVADATGSVKDVANYITAANGGMGAVRELIDILLAHEAF